MGQALNQTAYSVLHPVNPCLTTVGICYAYKRERGSGLNWVVSKVDRILRGSDLTWIGSYVDRILRGSDLTWIGSYVDRILRGTDLKVHCWIGSPCFDLGKSGLNPV